MTAFLSAFDELTQAELAEMTGLSRKSVNGHLLRMQAGELVQLAYGGVQLLDRPKLRELVGRHTS